MIDAPDWFVYAFDLLVFVAIFFGLIYLKSWYNVKKYKGKMLAEIWEPNGHRPKHIVKPDPDGTTITWDNLVYRLPRELGEKEITELQEAGKPVPSHTYPRRCWVEIINWPTPSIPVRIESWERNNPEPIRPFYGRIDKDGKFVDSQLTVTSTEWAAQKSVIQATAIAMSVQEREAKEKEWARGMANLPNKWVMYLGLGIIVLLGAINLFM